MQASAGPAATAVPSAPAPGGAAEVPSLPPAAQDRGVLIKHGTLSLIVSDAATAEHQVQDLMKVHGAYIAERESHASVPAGAGVQSAATAASKALRISPAVWNLASGSAFSPRARKARMSPGSSLAGDRSSGAYSGSTFRASTSNGVAPSNGLWPASSSYAMTATA